MKKNGFLVGFLFFINIFLLLSGITCYFLYLKEVKYLKIEFNSIETVNSDFRVADGTFEKQ